MDRSAPPSPKSNASMDANAMKTKKTFRNVVAGTVAATIALIATVPFNMGGCSGGNFNANNINVAGMIDAGKKAVKAEKSEPVAQAIGESQASQASGPSVCALVSLAARRTYAAPSTLIAIPRADPALAVSWAATAPTAANIHPVPANSMPMAMDPAVGRS